MSILASRWHRDEYGDYDPMPDYPDYDEGEEPDQCMNCSGSGEGAFDGSTCSVCKGKGVI